MPDRVDERADPRTEEHAVHDRQRVGHRERRRGDDRKNQDRQRIAAEPERAEQVFDFRLPRDDECRERERSAENERRLEAAEKHREAGPHQPLLCGHAREASAFKRPPGGQRVEKLGVFLPYCDARGAGCTMRSPRGNTPLVDPRRAA